MQVPKNEKEPEEVEITISGPKNGKKDNDQLSPRAVLEIHISGTSDSDNSSISSGERSRSFGSSPSPAAEKPVVSGESVGGGGGGEETGQGLRFKIFLDQMKRKSIRRLSALPLLGRYENLLGKKNIKRKLLSRIRSAEEDTIDCHDFVVPKPSWRNFTFDELAQATDNFTPGKFSIGIQ